MTTIYLLDTWQDVASPVGDYRAPKCLSEFEIGPYVDMAGADYTPPPAPNVAVVQISDGPELVAAIEAHPDYGPGSILMDSPNPYPGAGKPDATEFGQRRSYCAKLGISQAQFRAMFGTQANPNTRKDGADNLIAWARILPKGIK